MGSSMPQQMSVVVITEDRVTGEALACACERRGVTATVCGPGDAAAVTGEVVILDLTAHEPSVTDWPLVSGPATRTVVVGGSSAVLPTGAVVDHWVADDRSVDDLLDAVTSPGTSTAAPSVDVARTRNSVGSLTAREREVLGALLAGDGVPGMARRLQIAENTVRTHLQNVFAKLGVNSRAEAAAYALRHGLADDRRQVSA